MLDSKEVVVMSAIVPPRTREATVVFGIFILTGNNVSSTKTVNTKLMLSGRVLRMPGGRSILPT